MRSSYPFAIRALRERGPDIRLSSPRSWTGRLIVGPLLALATREPYAPVALHQFTGRQVPGHPMNARRSLPALRAERNAPSLRGVARARNAALRDVQNRIALHARGRGAGDGRGMGTSRLGPDSLQAHSRRRRSRRPCSRVSQSGVNACSIVRWLTLKVTSFTPRSDRRQHRWRARRGFTR